jgi:S1-C subfamily serine protease
MSKKLDKLKSKMKKVSELSLSVALASTKIALKVTAALAAVLVIVYLAARAPEMHSSIIREKVGEKTYKIRGGLNTGGGTGFSIKGKSGITYIVSNAHVCEVTPDGYHVLVSSDNGKHMWRRIIEISDKSDLCIIEGLPGVEGLSLGSEPLIGQIVASIGHPSLMPITLSRGEIIAPEDIKIFKGVVLDPDSDEDSRALRFVHPDYRLTPDQCNAPKNQIVTQEVDMFFFKLKVKLCLDVTRGAYRTNILIQSGNSGSPVVNFWGNVVGVVFAKDSYNWGIVVSNKDLRDLLSNY